MKQLPMQFYRYFWDTDPTTIDVENKAAYVISRILQWGRASDLKLLREIYGLDALKIVVRRSRELSRKHGTYYSLIYGIPKEEVLCLQVGSRLQHSGVWNH